MHRFFVPAGQISGNVIQLSGAEAHHAVQVLRLKSGDGAAVLDGEGNTYTGQIISCSRRLVCVQIVDKVTALRPLFELHLFQAVTKTKSMDLILQKSLEIGIHSITPILATRTVVQLGPRDKMDKLVKWQTQIIETLKQCGFPWLPKVSEPCSVNEGLEQISETDLCFVATFDSSAQHPRDLIDQFKKTHGFNPKRVGLWIGPEGDFTSDEIHSMYAKGVLPITLGQSILRSETAAIYGLSCLHYELSWLHQTDKLSKVGEIDGMRNRAQ